MDFILITCTINHHTVLDLLAVLLVFCFTCRLNFVGTSLEMVVATALAEQARMVFQIFLAPTTFTFGLGCPGMGFLPGELPFSSVSLLVARLLAEEECFVF